MRILMLGGSWMLGRLLVQASIQRGFLVSVFNGGTKPHEKKVEHLVGSRSSIEDLKTLAQHGPWDVAVDISGKVPGLVGQTAKALCPFVDRYVSISSVRVYQDFPFQPTSEQSPILPTDPNLLLDRPWLPDEYGQLKAGCERACQKVFSEERLLIFRLHEIVGQMEAPDPVQWWLNAFTEEDSILIPNCRTPIQAIDVRDIADFVIRQIELTSNGVFNVGATEPRSLHDLVEACRKAVGSKSRAELLEADPEWLVANGITTEMDIPLWSRFTGNSRVCTEKARRYGLDCRSLSSTASDTWQWLQSDTRPKAKQRYRKLGLSPHRQAALVASWRQRHSGRNKLSL